MSRAYQNLVDRIFGQLTVIAEAERSLKRPDQRLWSCRCSCGNAVARPTAELLRGNATHCGCLTASVHARTIKLAQAKGVRHGACFNGSQTPEYRSWHHMQIRCYLQTDKNFFRYGARGVRVADEWRGPGGFERFLAHIGPRPTPTHSVDRFPDRNGNYEPGNVRWATDIEQTENRDCTIYIEVNGDRQSVAEWSKRSG